MVGRRSLFPFWKAFKERKILKFGGVCVIQYSQPLFGQPGLHNKAPGGKSTRLSCSCRGTFGSYFATWKNEFTWSWQVFFCLGILCFMPVFWGDDSLWQTCLKWVVQPQLGRSFLSPSDSPEPFLFSKNPSPNTIFAACRILVQRFFFDSGFQTRFSELVTCVLTAICSKTLSKVADFNLLIGNIHTLEVLGHHFL